MSYLDDEWCADQIFGVLGGKKKRSGFLFDYDELIDTLNKAFNKEEDNKKEDTNMNNNNNTNTKGDNFSINFDTDFENFIHAVGCWNGKEYSSTVTASQCKDNIFDFNEAKSIACDEVIDKILKVKNKKNIEVGDIVKSDGSCYFNDMNWFKNNNISYELAFKFKYGCFPDTMAEYDVIVVSEDKALIKKKPTYMGETDCYYLVGVDSLTLVEKSEAK